MLRSVSPIAAGLSRLAFTLCACCFCGLFMACAKLEDASQAPASSALDAEQEVAKVRAGPDATRPLEATLVMHHTNDGLGMVFTVTFLDSNTLVTGGSVERDDPENLRIWHAYVRVWDVRTKTVKCATRRDNAVYRVIPTPDRESLVIGSCEKKVGIWHLAKNLVEDIEVAERYVGRISLSSDGKLLAVMDMSYRTIASIWDLKAKKKISDFEGHPNWIEDIGFIPKSTALCRAA